MGVWARTGRLTRAGLLLGVGLAGGGAAVAVATVPDSNGVIHACYSVDASGVPVTTSGANVTIVDPSAGQNCVTNSVGRPPPQHALNWNVSGPPGAQGSPGQQGPQGPPGPTSTVTSGGKLTLPGGQVLTVESSGGGVTLPRPSGRLRGGSDVAIGSGRDALSFPILEVSALDFHAGGGAGRATVHDISITKTVDKTSPKLFLACVNGQHFKKVTITLRKAGGQKYLRYTLSDVLITAVQTSGHGGQAVPSETVSFNYGKVAIEYQAQK